MTVEPYLAALVWKTHRPVRMVWERQDSLLARQKRHPFRMHYRTGVMDDGTIVAQDIRILGDAGAYPLLSSRVLFAGGVNSTGPYRCPDARMESTAVFTNTVPTSAMRGFGAMQVVFGYESQMDLIVKRLGLTPEGVRERNFVERGDIRVTGEPIDTHSGTRECMRLALAELGELSAPTKGGLVGRGFACSMQPYGRSMFFCDRASAWIGLEQDGAMATPRRSHRRRCRPGCLAGQHRRRDTRRHSRPHQRSHRRQPPQSAHRRNFRDAAALHVGQRRCQGGAAAAEKLAPVACDLLGCEESELEWANNLVGLVGGRARSVTMAELSRTAEARGITPDCHDSYYAEKGHFDLETGSGRTYPDYTYGCHAVDVEVDERTGEVWILKYVAVHDVSRAIYMQRVEGQIQGAAAQGIGYAMSEEVELEGGVITSTLFANYLIPNITRPA